MPQPDESVATHETAPQQAELRALGFSQTSKLNKEQIQVLLQMIAPELASTGSPAREFQEQLILSDITCRITCYFHYDDPTQMPARLIETFLDRLEQGIEAGSKGWKHCQSQPQAMKEVLERAFDWGLVSGIMKRPKAATLH